MMQEHDGSPESMFRILKAAHKVQKRTARRLRMSTPHFPEPTPPPIIQPVVMAQLAPRRPKTPASIVIGAILAVPLACGLFILISTIDSTPRKSSRSIVEPRRQTKPSPAPAAAVEPPPERKSTEEKRLVLLANTIEYRDPLTVRQISGIVENRTGRRVSYAQISFNLFDREGNQVGTAFDNIRNLEAGARWKFTAHSFEDRAVSFRLAELKDSL
jgi:hypothetical protein